MRKHRLYGFVLAMLLGTGVFTLVPNSNDNHNTPFAGAAPAAWAASPTHVRMAGPRMTHHTRSRRP
ncbi:MAG: hypothetical protein ACREC5_05465, partial [Thermoplasmata archaeon]